MSSQQLDLCSKPLIGHQLTSAEKIDYSWFFRFTGGAVVATESPWRLIDQERIVTTSEDHGHPFGFPEPVDAGSRVMSSTAGRTVATASISRTSGDLTIEFGERLQLQLLQMSSGYEAWRLSSPSGEVICMGGGSVEQLPRT